MVSQLLTIARNTFLESVRQPIYFVLIALAGLCQLFTTWSAGFSMGMSEGGEVKGDNKLMLDMSMATVFVCGMLLAAFLATAVISREIDRKTVLTVVSKPVSRVTVVLGKYLGVALAIVIAVLTMLLFLQMGLRHEVMSTAADDVDGPVVLFTAGAVLLALGVGIWCNFFYGWSFVQTTTLLLFPLMLVAWLMVLLISKKWHFQDIHTNFKPQIALACISLVFAQLVMTAIATAASARLGQVMTLVVCCGVFFLGLLSNHFLGSRAIQNTFSGRIESAAPEQGGHASLSHNGDIYQVRLELVPRNRVTPGASFHFGPNPSGFGMATIPFPPLKGDVTDREVLESRAQDAGIVVTSISDKELRVQRFGADGLVAFRPPQPGDYFFLQPTSYNAAAIGAWGIFPNVQFFWLTDAVTQNQRIPAGHVWLTGLYALVQVGAALSLAVALFQTREVG